MQAIQSGFYSLGSVGSAVGEAAWSLAHRIRTVFHRSPEKPAVNELFVVSPPISNEPEEEFESGKPILSEEAEQHIHFWRQGNNALLRIRVAQMLRREEPSNQEDAVFACVLGMQEANGWKALKIGRAHV